MGALRSCLGLKAFGFGFGSFLGLVLVRGLGLGGGFVSFCPLQESFGCA